MITRFNGRRAGFRLALLAGAASMALPSVAQAQDADDDDDLEMAQPADGDDFPPQEDVATGNRIIITATKREQTLQEVPVAVSVTTAETIERAQIRDIADLQSVVPSLRVSTLQSPFATSFSVRGFGTDGNNLGLEPSVAVFVDGVYRSRAISQISDLPSLQRIEVLRGPQSTLFGKNASAGVISIISREPEFTLSGNFEASYGNYNAVVVKGYVTGPVTDTIAASISGGYNRRDGYITNGFNGDDLNNRNRWFTRGQLLFEPTPELSVRIIGDYDELNEKCCGVVNVRRSPASLAVLAVGGQLNDPADRFEDVVFTDVVPNNEVRNWGVSGQVDYAFGPLALTSITAYRETRIDANQDVDFSSAPIASGANIGQARIDTFTQELRLASDLVGPFNFLIGGFYFDENLRTQDQIVFGPAFRPFANILIQQASGGALSVAALEQLGGLPPGTFFAAGQGFNNDFSQNNRAYSLFGQFDFEVTDRLTLTGGVNYTNDKKDVVSNSVSTDVFSNTDLRVIRNNATNFGIAQTIGGILRVPGGLASPAQIGAFAAGNAGAFAQIQAGAAAATAPILGLSALQFLPPPLNIPNAVEDGKTRDDDWSYIARANYEVNNLLNVYVSYATGFKASSFNLSRDSRPLAADLPAIIGAGINPVNLRAGSRFALPEESTVYELGIKAAWDVGSMNLTFFQQSIENFQTNTFTGGGFIFANAGEQSTFGVEFDGLFTPTPALTLSLGVTYLDPQYDEFVNSPFGDLSGQRVAGIPAISASFGAQYVVELLNADQIVLRSDFAYESPVNPVIGLPAFITVNPNGTRNFDAARAVPRDFQREVNNLNASISYVFDMGLEFSLWGRNLLDDRYLQTIFDSVAQGGSISGYPNQPRTYGVSARFRF